LQKIVDRKTRKEKNTKNTLLVSKSVECKWWNWI